MGSVNKVIILGRLGKDPEVRQTQTGKQVCNFSVATSSGSGDNERTEWHNCVAWEKAAEIASKYLAKGKEVHLEGRLQTRVWDDKEGNKKYSTEIVVERITLIGSAPAAATGGQLSATPDDDVPF